MINLNNSYTVRLRNYTSENSLLGTTVYVIIAQDIEELSNGLKEQTRDILWNPRVTFIVHIRKIAAGHLKKVFNIFMYHKIYEVILLNFVNSKNTEILTYFPFDKNNCGDTFDEIVNIGLCRDIKDISKLFLKNVEYSLRNCVIKVAAKEDIPMVILKSSNYTVFGEYVLGLEQYMLETITAVEGFTINYEYYDADTMYGVVLPNRSTSGLLSRLQDGKISLAAGGFVLIQNRVEVFDYIWGYNYADLILLTPSTKQDVWKKVYREFGLKIWLLIILAYAFMVCFTATSRILTSTEKPEFLMLSIKLCAYFYGHSDNRLFKNTKPKSVIVVWALFTFFINSFYNTAYYSLVTGHVKEERTFDYDDINTLPYDPCVSDDMRTFFQYAYNITLPKGIDNPDCRFTESAMNTVASRKDVYAIEMDYSYKLREFMYIDNDGNHLIDTWDFYYDSVVTIYATRGFPYKDKFQKYALYMYEAGLMQRQLRLIYIKNLNSMKHLKHKYKKVGLADFRIHFVVLAYGITISLFCFLCERLKPRCRFNFTN
ncbi:hypothetical protein RR48_12731 [Papilio machaon]|uniref:Uncharacterized protein n=1 Tax=Papilio machaon TaxID=76193 RepID=A0A194QRC0_PAPMA|nr:hypothetical protein RR48_12731 [Papilio machaon]